MKTDNACVPFWAPPLLAIQFLTRVPVPGVSKLPPEVIRDGLVRATGWFPLVGALIGAVSAAVVVACESGLPRVVAVFLALVIEARLTGAFHEDAVADTCDALGGGRDPAHVREIMKDSRIGSYGALGLVLAVGLRAALMTALPAALLLPGIIAAAAFGRFLAVLIMRIVPPAQVSQGLGKDIGGRVRNVELLLATLLVAPACLWLGWLSPLGLATGLAGAAVFIVWFRRLALCKVGGATGDCLGFAAYAGQLILLLSTACAWPA